MTPLLLQSDNQEKIVGNYATSFFFAAGVLLSMALVLHLGPRYKTLYFDPYDPLAELKFNQLDENYFLVSSPRGPSAALDCVRLWNSL